MDKTQNDLSFNHTKLDYLALITTARVAYRHVLEEIYKYHRTLRDNPDNTRRTLAARDLLAEAEYLVVVAETLSTLLEGLDREELEVVNRPDVVNVDMDKIERR